ncbi:DUF7282 domain-containing protein [Erythrobacter sp. W53]|uniref:DUF7282 domain-containing protein n=1 Tax=Erythrobacter sp. W53 TaxID=3425947 RepID=UPI003D767464
MIRLIAATAMAFSGTACASETTAVNSASATQSPEASPEPAPSASRITLGNGEQNSIQIEGLKRVSGVTPFSFIRADDKEMSSFRGDSTALTFSEVVIAKPGFIVLHPVIDGRPNGDMVSGFTYLEAGKNEDVTVRIDHPADTGEKFLVMLHTDVDQDRVLDFVFVEDGINVEDTAVFEGTTMVAHIFAVP